MIALADWSYGFYQLLRLAVTGYAAWVAVCSAGRFRPKWAWLFGFIAVLYNPWLKISMTRDAHAVENVCTAIVIVAEMLWARRQNEESP